MEDFRWHDLRHTWASWHVQGGTSLQDLMAMGGWSSYDLVLRYAHLAPEHLAEAAARIESGRTLSGTPLKAAISSPPAAESSLPSGPTR
ncbi:tyrosine-type recombinase/integrase [Allochromatium palmeri]|uniref:tyrosine-type recombinase/integrase n=1 Tax=Allochromatium palmeri TaxID=231048 RepID=UPI0031B61897